jgi:hypothetical protein
VDFPHLLALSLDLPFSHGHVARGDAAGCTHTPPNVTYALVREAGKLILQELASHCSRGNLRSQQQERIELTCVSGHHYSQRQLHKTELPGQE